MPDNMHQTRREFLLTASAASAAAMLGLGPLTQHAFARGKASKALKILFLGGTGMLGPHVVRILLDRGHEVTLFNRGNRNEMFPDLEFIQGNRIVDIDPGLQPLQDQIDTGRTWDAVIDTASVHTWVENSAKLLAGHVDHYTYISSLSVYADHSQTGLSEDDAVATMPDEIADEITTPRYNMQYYGAVKARSEDAARRHFPGKALVHRPGLLVGPRDFTHRFTYWPHRIREGGEVLAPGSADHPVQFIDVRDLAAFMVMGIENGSTGTFNVNGPVGGGMTIGALLEACQAATGSDATFTWAESDWLTAQGVNAWAQMPVWIPPVEGYAGFHSRDIAKAIAAGLSTRPLADTIIDTLTWLDDEYLPGWKQAMADRGEADAVFGFGEGRPGITREREAELLEMWKAR
ncbi:MAG: NAD-dependent epimerase/dehydratase family protein [Phycisphaerales bacterium]|nr:NAD-dependent epimerase/dehydratase family protein [Phycisphaerales bacterium]